MLNALIEILQCITEDPTVTIVDPALESHDSGSINPLIYQAIELANHCLVTAQQQCNWRAINALTRAGFLVQHPNRNTISGLIQIPNKGNIPYG